MVWLCKLPPYIPPPFTNLSIPTFTCLTLWQLILILISLSFSHRHTHSYTHPLQFAVCSLCNLKHTNSQSEMCEVWSWKQLCGVYLWCITETEGVVAYKTPTDNKNSHHIYVIFHGAFTHGLILVCRLLDRSFPFPLHHRLIRSQQNTYRLPKKEANVLELLQWWKRGPVFFNDFKESLIAAGVVGKVVVDVKCAWMEHP